jgi:hypothetical protein
MRNGGPSAFGQYAVRVARGFSKVLDSPATSTSHQKEVGFVDRVAARALQVLDLALVPLKPDGHYLRTIRLGLTHGISAREYALTRYAEEFDMNGIASTKKGKRLTLDLYQMALNRFIEAFRRSITVKDLERTIVSGRINILSVVGEITEDDFELGIYKPYITIGNARALIFKNLQRDAATHEQLPSAIQVKFALIGPESKGFYFRRAVDNAIEQIFNEFGVLIMPFKPALIRSAESPDIPIDQVAGDGLVKMLRKKI